MQITRCFNKSVGVYDAHGLSNTRHHIVIVVPDDAGFLRRLTKVAFFLLLLAFTDGHDVSVVISDNNLIGGNGRRDSFHQYLAGYTTRPADFISYDGTMSITKRFNMKRSQVQTSYPPVPIEGCNRCCNATSTTVGRNPTNSGKWFSSMKDVVSMRHKISLLCSRGDGLTENHTSNNSDNTFSSFSQELRIAQPNILVSRKRDGFLFSNLGPTAISGISKIGQIKSETDNQRFRIVIFERDSNRNFKDLEGIISFLSQNTDTIISNGNKESIVTWDIDVLYHSNDMDPCLLHVALSNADIFLTTHGFQSTGIICYNLTCYVFIYYVFIYHVFIWYVLYIMFLHVMFL